MNLILRFIFFSVFAVILGYTSFAQESSKKDLTVWVELNGKAVDTDTLNLMVHTDLEKIKESKSLLKNGKFKIEMDEKKLAMFYFRYHDYVFGLDKYTYDDLYVLKGYKLAIYTPEYEKFDEVLPIDLRHLDIKVFYSIDEELNVDGRANFFEIIEYVN